MPVLEARSVVHGVRRAAFVLTALTARTPRAVPVDRTGTALEESDWILMGLTGGGPIPSEIPQYLLNAPSARFSVLLVGGLSLVVLSGLPLLVVLSGLLVGLGLSGVLGLALVVAGLLVGLGLAQALELALVVAGLLVGLGLAEALRRVAEG